MEGWSGEGVAIPFPDVVVVGGSVVVSIDLTVVIGAVIGTLDVDDVVDTIHFDVVEVNVGVEVVDDELCDDGGSDVASTQYDFPMVRPPQSAVMDGFYSCA